MQIVKFSRLLTAALGSLLLANLITGCSQFSYANYNQQKVIYTPATTENTRASTYLYLNPLEPNQKTVYITMINSSGSDEFAVKPHISNALEEKGYTIVNNTDQANIVVRANLVRIGSFTNEQQADMRNSEFGNSAAKIQLPTQKQLAELEQKRLEQANQTGQENQTTASEETNPTNQGDTADQPNSAEKNQSHSR